MGLRNKGISSRDDLRAGWWEALGLPFVRHRYGRSLATCEVDGENIQQWMARNGWGIITRPI
jgi:endonuclease YncB( thermonuclease family)